MKAAILREINRPLLVTDVDIDPPRQGEVMVRMVAGGVCHSDLHAIHGDLAAPLPVVPGHEGAGIVEKVGPGVRSVVPGDHVLLLWRASCGKCYFCSRGRPALCDLGSRIRWSGKLGDGTARFHWQGQEVNHFGGVSSFAEYSVLVEEAVIKIPNDISLVKAALVGCAVMTGVGAVMNTAQVEAGSSVAVIGAGGVGLNVIQGAALVGAERIIAVDLLDNKLEYARQFGATHTVNAGRQDVAAVIRDLTAGRGVDYAFEVIGQPKTIAQALEATRRGGKTVLIGIPATGALVAIAAQPFVLQEKTLIGSLYGTTVPHRDVPMLLGLYAACRLKLDELISREYPLADINEAFAALERGEVARSVIHFPE